MEDGALYKRKSINFAKMNLRDIININEEELTPGALHAGTILVANPLLREPFFFRSVALLIDFEEEKGCLGLTLNKESTLKMGDFLEGYPQFAEIPVYCGGPVDAHRLFMLHTLGESVAGSVEIFPGLWLGGNFGDAFKFLEMGGELEGNIRFFLGYSGWTKGQLEKEIEENAWGVYNRPDALLALRGKEEEYWHRTVKKMGEEYRPWLMLPENPTDN